jgi:ubiquinone biosynthesis protein
LTDATVNWLQFGRLIFSLYRRGGPLPDLEWIESLGLLAVKLCQIHALRIDFLRRDKCEHLARLYRRNRALPSEEFRVLLERSASPEVIANFSSIDDVALASASVGQVHRARLISSDDVVVKVVKADARDQFVADVASLKRLLNLAVRIYPRLRRVGDPMGILEDVETYTLSDLDLRNEISGQRALKEILEQHTASFDLHRLKFPTIYTALSARDVLVSEFVPGASIDELLENGDLQYEDLVELFRLHGFFMFCVGSFHGDLHPGNVIVHGDDFYLVDTGYVATIEPQLRDGLFRFFASLAYYEYADCARHLNAMSIRPLEGEAFSTFERDFMRLYSDFRDSTVSEVSLTTRMMQTIKLGVNAGMAFERSIFAIIRSLMYLDGMVLRCNPNAVLVRDMRPLLDEFLAARPDGMQDS